MKQVKLSLCFINEAPRHEDVWGSGGLAPPFLTLGLDGGEKSALHPGRVTPPPLREENRYKLDKMLSGPQSQSERCGEEKTLLLLPGIEPRLSCP
jgi:hypothetical protein